jgi:hypothetical protein
MAASNFDFGNFLIRLLAALTLVIATYNPSGYSFVHWVQQSLPGFDPLVAFVGVVLLIGWVIFIRATMRSIGLLGILLILALFGTLLWLIVDIGWLSLENTRVLTWVVEIILAMILATGMSWSHIRRRLTGQLDVDDVDEVD